MENLQDILKQTPAATQKANTEAGLKDSEKEFVCPKCKGAGYVYVLNSDGTTDYRNTKPCECTIANSNAHRQESIKQYSNMGKLIEISFESLNPEGKRKNKAKQLKYSKAYNLCKEYAENPTKWLYIFGKPGSGKTGLAAAIGNKQCELKNFFLYFTAADLIDRIKQAQFDEDIPYEETFLSICKTPLLIIDDYKLHNDNEFAKEKIDQILTYRLNYDLPLVITSHLHPHDLDERLQQRFLDEEICKVIELDPSSESEVYEWPPAFELQKSFTFDTFDHEQINKSKDVQINIEKAYNAALEYAKSPEGWLTILGPTGVGKTHLAAAIVNYRYDKGLPATFVVVQELLNQLKSSFSNNNNSDYSDIFKRIKEAPFLVLDDLGVNNSTPWVKDELYQIINNRYNSKLPTVITTSYALDKRDDKPNQEVLDSRIASRITDTKIGNAIEIFDSDYNKENTAKPRYSRAK